MTQQAITRFDLDNLDTPAMRKLTEQREDLEREVAAHRASLTERGNSETVETLQRLVTRLGFEKPKNKADWVEMYVSERIAEIPAHRLLGWLRSEAQADRSLARTLNEMMDEGSDEQAATDMANIARLHFTAMVGAVEGVIVRRATAQRARRLHRLVANGVAPLREAAIGEALSALKDMQQYIGVGGRIGGTLLSEPEAVAANIFCQRILAHLPEVPLTSKDLLPL
jgi:hypothetical protein